MTEEADAVATDPIVYVEGMYGETLLKTTMEDKEGALKHKEVLARARKAGRALFK